MAATTDVTLEAVHAYAAKTLAGYKRPQHLTIVPAVPMERLREVGPDRRAAMLDEAD
ncbi:hypothetical protein [Streptomyces stelliscabiei]|uniref:hypothetical protein n=1 Tax=Streptomyces stelliscabiei TaxID=146820 RepID=UPI002FF3DAFB